MAKKLLAVLLIALLFSVSAFAAQAMPWDPLRPLSNAAAQFDFVTKYLVFFLSLGLFGISVLAFNKIKKHRFLLIALAFFFFAAKWFLKILDIYFSPGAFLPDSSENVFELLILALLFLAIFKK